MITAMTITPTTLDARSAVRYREVTATYMSNEAKMFPESSTTASNLRMLKASYTYPSWGGLDQVRAIQSQVGMYGAHRANLSQKNLPILLRLG